MELLGAIDWVEGVFLRILGLFAFILFVGIVVQIKAKLNWKLKGWGDPFTSGEQYKMVLMRVSSLQCAGTGVGRPLKFRSEFVDDPHYLGFVWYDPKDSTFQVLI